MAKKSNEPTQITVSQLRNVHKDTYQPTKTVGWNGLKVVIKKQLSLGEMIGFIQGVVDVCFNAETGAYFPEVKNHAIKMMTLQNYANFNMPKKAAEQFVLVNQTDAFEAVKQHIDKEQFDTIVEAIDQRIEYAKAQYNGTHGSSTNGISDLLSQITDALENIDEDTVKSFMAPFIDDANDAASDSTESNNAELPNLVLVDADKK